MVLVGDDDCVDVAVKVAEVVRVEVGEDVNVDVGE